MTTRPRGRGGRASAEPAHTVIRAFMRNLEKVAAPRPKVSETKPAGPKPKPGAGEGGR